MPKAYISKEQRQRARLAAWIYGNMKTRHIPQRQLADEMGISQAGFSQKMNKQIFTYSDLLVIFRVLKPSEKELVMLLGLDE